jgi:phage shock protein PspC (stress-responsive transcriptional regulator)
VRRLYRIQEGAMLSGVCNGLGAYCGIDPTFIRIGFVVLTFFWGAGFLVYLLMSFVVPAANTPAEKAAASGMAATAQEFIRRARTGYYEGMKSFHDKHAHRAWKRKFKQEMRGWKHSFRHEMHANAQPWQENWPQHPPSVFGPVFIAPLLSILLFALLLAMIYAIYSLVTAHAVLGVALPAGMPLWVGILLTVILFQLIAWPVKAARCACYYPGRYYGRCGPWGGLFGSLIGLFFLAFGIWSLDRHVPEFHEWLVQLPTLLHRLVDTVQSWFARR